MNNVLLRRCVTFGGLLLLLTPLVWSPFTLFPFVWGKALYVRLLAVFLCPLLALMWMRVPASRPRRSALHLGMLLFLISMGISTIFGVDAHQSFWGREERLWGFVGIAYLGIAYLTMLAVTQTSARPHRLIKTAAIISLVNALWATFEVFFPDFWKAVRGGDRAIGTIGNPIFLGSYLLLSAFLAIAAARSSARRRGQIFFVLIAVFDVSALFLTGTRGAFFGLVAGLLAGGIVYLAKKNLRAVPRRKLILMGTVILTLVFAFIIASRVTPQIRRLTDFSRRDATTIQRVLLWQTTIAGFRERPILGWGPENFDYLFDQHFNPQFLRYSIRETWADRAHNVFFDLLATQGIIGIIIGGLMLYGIGRRVLRLEALSASIFAGFIVAYLGQGATAFNTLPTLIPLMVGVAFLEGTASNQRQSDQEKIMPVTLSVVTAIAFGIGALASFVIVGVRPALASNKMLQALQTLDPERRLRFADASLAIAQPYRDDVRLRFANMVFLNADEGGSSPAKRLLLERARAQMRSAIVAHPKDYAYRFTLANLTLSLAIDYDASYYSEAEEQFKTAAQYSPHRQSTWLQLGNQKLIQGDAMRAIEYFITARDLDPTVGEPHWHLGRAYADANMIEEAHDAFEKSREQGFISNVPGELNVALGIYDALKDYRGMPELFLNLFAVRKPNATTYGGLAEVLARLGEDDCARRAVAKTVALDPESAEEARLFIEALARGDYRDTPRSSPHPPVACELLINDK